MEGGNSWLADLLHLLKRFFDWLFVVLIISESEVIILFWWKDKIKEGVFFLNEIGWCLFSY